VFPDSKTFVDARPRAAPAGIAARYAAAVAAGPVDLSASDVTSTPCSVSVVASAA